LILFTYTKEEKKMSIRELSPWLLTPEQGAALRGEDGSAVSKNYVKKMRAKQGKCLRSILALEQKRLGVAFGSPGELFAPNTEPTRDLLLGNCGASLGVAWSRLHACMVELKVQPVALHMAPALPYAFCHFASEHEAATVRAAFNCRVVKELGAEDGSTVHEKPLFCEYSRLPCAKLYGVVSADDAANAALVLTGPQEIQAHSWASQSPSASAHADGPPAKRVKRERENGAPEVEGLVLVREFLTKEQEQAIISFCDSNPWEEHTLRHVQHYGLRFDYKTNGVKELVESDQLPDAFGPVLALLRQSLPRATSVDYPCVDAYRHTHRPSLEDVLGQAVPAAVAALIADYCLPRESESGGYYGYTPDQITVNKYYPGHGIPAHIDTHYAFSDLVLSISLNADVVMNFDLYDGREHSSSNDALQSTALNLPARSMVCLTGEARYKWCHSIKNRQQDLVNEQLVRRQLRYSLTFRKVLSDPVCLCEYKSHCDNPENAGPERK
jgi:alkylated DNA repair dioxygenase AlkB